MTTITLKTLLSVAQFSRLNTVKGGGWEGGENVETALHEYFFGPDCLAYISSLDLKRSTGLLTVLTYFFALI